jgi:3'(2'), 5'-bisphosphate nucleotidase
MFNPRVNPSEQLDVLCDLAKSIGWGAADILLKERAAGFQIGGDSDSPVTSADLAANDHILSRLQSELDDTFAYLSEETFKTQDKSDRLQKSWVWIIDPLDGTKDYIQDTGDYAVQIALAYQGRPIVAVVACPAKNKLYSAIQGQGTWVEAKSGTSHRAKVSTRSQPSELIAVTSRNHLGEELKDLIKKLKISSQRQMGSVGCKVSAIVDQGADLYISISGKTAPKDWDFAAPELILTEAGGTLTYINGGLISYNREDVNQWESVLATNSTCHDFIRHTAQAILNQSH